MEDEIISAGELVTVVEVDPMDDYRLRIVLSNGRKGIFDVKPYLNSEFFKELQNVKYFRRVFVSYDTVAWPHEQDIAPETIEAGLQPELSPVTLR